MYTKIFLLILAILPCLHSQNTESLYFPDDNGGILHNGEIMKIIPSNLSEIRGTTMYEKYVDKIISGGIAKLTIAINKVLLQKNADTQDNVVFAPVSITGALSLILLGSNGKTFQEIISAMGLATGIDVQTKSLQIHEQFGRLIAKLQATSGFSGQQVNFAHGIFVQNNYPIRSIYKKTAEDLYQSEILNVDFKSNPGRAQQIINAWVSERTNGKIKDIIEAAPLSDTKVIIVSAMYFKAMWEYPFFEGTTTRRPFYVNGRKTSSNILVEMMANGGEFPYFNDRTLNCEVIGFPYKGNGSTMYVVMPHNSNVQRLKELENVLTASDLDRLADSTVYTRAIMLFPKMRLESSIDLKSTLERLGIKSLFSPTESNLALISPGQGHPQFVPTKIAAAEINPLSVNQDNDIIIFSRSRERINCTGILYQTKSNAGCDDANKIPRIRSRISTARSGETIDNLRNIINQQSRDNSYQNPGLYADKVVHKVFMDITETGTEAAAATSVTLSRDGSRVTFRVDVPFFFFIRNEETKTILFWGSVTTPTPHFAAT